MLTATDTHYAQPKTFGIADEIESYVIKGFNISVIALFDETFNVETMQELVIS